MTLKNFFGAAILILLFAALFMFIAVIESFMVAAFTFGSAAVLAGIIFFAVWLLES